MSLQGNMINTSFVAIHLIYFILYSDIELRWPDNVKTIDEFKKLRLEKRHIKIFITSPEKQNEFAQRLKGQIVPSGTTSSDSTPFEFSFSVASTAPEPSSPECENSTGDLEIKQEVAKVRAKFEESFEDFRTEFQKQLEQMNELQEQHKQQMDKMQKLLANWKM